MSALLNYTEIKTKITSTFTFVYIIGYLLYIKAELNVANTLIFALSMFLFDLTTTAINNYIDSKDNGQSLPYSRTTALMILYLLLFLSVATGIWLYVRTDEVILIAGAVCFACGVLYTFGPIPISRQPLGEMLSGFFYGIMIPFIMMYINLPKDKMIMYEIKDGFLNLSLNIEGIGRLVLIGIIPFSVTANIMLANNICDVEKDITVKRFTLPFYLGKKQSLWLFTALYGATYIATLIMVALKILPFTNVIALITIPVVINNLKRFYKEQVKSKTFIVSIKNFMLIMGGNIIGVYLGLLV